MESQQSGRLVCGYIEPAHSRPSDLPWRSQTVVRSTAAHIQPRGRHHRRAGSEATAVVFTVTPDRGQPPPSLKNPYLFGGNAWAHECFRCRFQSLCDIDFSGERLVRSFDRVTSKHASLQKCTRSRIIMICRAGTKQNVLQNNASRGTERRWQEFHRIHGACTCICTFRSHKERPRSTTGLQKFSCAPKTMLQL